MIKARVVSMSGKGLMVELTEVREGTTIWRRHIDPDEAVFLSMDLDDVHKEIRQLTVRET